MVIFTKRCQILGCLFWLCVIIAAVKLKVNKLLFSFNFFLSCLSLSIFICRLVLIIIHRLTMRNKSDTVHKTNRIFVDIQYSFTRCLIFPSSCLCQPMIVILVLVSNNLNCHQIFALVHRASRGGGNGKITRHVFQSVRCFNIQLSENWKNGNTEVLFCVLFLSTVLIVNVNVYYYFQGLW